MNDNEKITFLDKLTKHCVTISLSIIAFVAGLALGSSNVFKGVVNSEPIISASAAVHTTNASNAILAFPRTGTAYSVVYTDITVRSVTTNPMNYGELFLTDSSGVLSSRTLLNPVNAVPFTIDNDTYNYSSSFQIPNYYLTVDGQSKSAVVPFLLYSQSVEFPTVDPNYSPTITLYTGSNYSFATYFPSISSSFGVQDFGVLAYCYDYITTRVDSSGNPIHSKFIVIFPTLNVRGSLTKSILSSSAQTNYQPDIDGAYAQGYEAGVQFADGRVNTQSASYQAGDQAGFDRGVISDTDYSMKSLFLALFDAPLTIIQKGLDFEFFGINLAGLVLSLLTFALAVFILRTFFFK